MRINIAPSWNPGYALPPNVRDEPLRRGTLTTAYRPRGSFDDPKPSPAWDPGYALPQNIRDEQLGANPIVTHYTPRGTVSSLMPPLFEGVVDDVIDEQKGTPDVNLQTGVSWLDDARWRYGFGGDDTDNVAATQPLRNFGAQTADFLVHEARKIPRASRQMFLAATLDKLEPGLAGRVKARAAQLARAGVRPELALREAISDNVQAGLVGEVLQTAQQGRVPQHSMLGLGSTVVKTQRGAGYKGPTKRMGLELVTSIRTTPAQRAEAKAKADQEKALNRLRSWAERGFLRQVEDTEGGGVVFNMPEDREMFSDHRPGAQDAIRILPSMWQLYEDAIRKHGDKVASGEAPFMKFKQGDNSWGVFLGPSLFQIRKYKHKKRPWYKRWASAAVRIFAAVATLGITEIWRYRKEIWDAIKWAADKVGEGACKLLNSGVGKAAIDVGATATTGAPPGTGATAATLASGLCNRNGDDYAPPPPESPSMMPMLLIGGGLAAAFLLTRK